MKFFQKLENLFSAAAFAEEGEFDTAREILAESAQNKQSSPAAGPSRLSGKKRGSSSDSKAA